MIKEAAIVGIIIILYIQKTGIKKEAKSEASVMLFLTVQIHVTKSV